MALDMLSSVKTYLKSDELTIDSVVFKLHYRLTVALLIGSSMIGVAKQYFGDPINCQVSHHVCLFCNQGVPSDSIRSQQ